MIFLPGKSALTFIGHLNTPFIDDLDQSSDDMLLWYTCGFQHCNVGIHVMAATMFES